jgi:hypothetical protein
MNSDLVRPGNRLVKRYYRVTEIARLMDLSDDTVRRLLRERYKHEPIIRVSTRREGVRKYETLLIPREVLERVLLDLSRAE